LACQKNNRGAAYLERTRRFVSDGRDREQAFRLSRVREMFAAEMFLSVTDATAALLAITMVADPGGNDSRGKPYGLRSSAGFQNNEDAPGGEGMRMLESDH
jgi:hypothetical protein